MIDAGYEAFAEAWSPIIDVFDAEGVRFALEVHPTEIAYTGPLSIEWEDAGMDRDFGAQDALAFVRRTDFPASDVAFDAAFSRD